MYLVLVIFFLIVNGNSFIVNYPEDHSTISLTLDGRLDIKCQDLCFKNLFFKHLRSPISGAIFKQNISRHYFSFFFDPHFNDTSNFMLSYKLETPDITLEYMKVTVEIQKDTDSTKLNIQNSKLNFNLSSGFDLVKHCDADFTMNVILPLAVGFILSGVIIIILIVYLFTQIKRSREVQGYEQITDEA
ncbi:hypothetical protein MXB_3953 [Myxobolus squamalis]|nr:hypothetical protein MXB_3953 [Myxobolus squamalis]